LGYVTLALDTLPPQGQADSLIRLVFCAGIFGWAIACQTPSTSLVLAHVSEAIATGDYAGARAALDHLIEIHPRDPDLLATRAHLHWRFGKYELAAMDLRRAIDIAPHEPSHRLSSAALCELRGDLDGAIADYDAACTLGALTARESRARLLCERGLTNDWDRSIADYDEELQVTPDRVDLLLGRAWALLGAGHTEKSFQAFSAAMEPHSESSRDWWRFGVAAWSTGRTEKAKKCFGNAIETGLYLAEGRLSRGLLHLALGEPEDALRDFSLFEAAEGSDVNYGSLLFVTTQVLLKMPSAQDSLAKTIAAQSASPDAKHHRTHLLALTRSHARDLLTGDQHRRDRERNARSVLLAAIAASYSDPERSSDLLEIISVTKAFSVPEFHAAVNLLRLRK
jgi:tetratricopeptide (TPR) repeat protein